MEAESCHVNKTHSSSLPFIGVRLSVRLSDIFGGSAPPVSNGNGHKVGRPRLIFLIHVSNFDLPLRSRPRHMGRNDLFGRSRGPEVSHDCLVLTNRDEPKILRPTPHPKACICPRTSLAMTILVVDEWRGAGAGCGLGCRRVDGRPMDF